MHSLKLVLPKTGSEIQHSLIDWTLWHTGPYQQVHYSIAWW